MNNVLQAAGRVIRRDDDRGVVVLADDRYCEEKYQVMFPDHWSWAKKADNAREVAEIIQKFKEANKMFSDEFKDVKKIF
jgi:CRISPR-associated exonuclease Cas4